MRSSEANEEATIHRTASGGPCRSETISKFCGLLPDDVVSGRKVGVTSAGPRPPRRPPPPPPSPRTPLLRLAGRPAVWAAAPLPPSPFSTAERWTGQTWSARTECSALLRLCPIPTPSQPAAQPILSSPPFLPPFQVLLVLSREWGLFESSERASELAFPELKSELASERANNELVALRERA